MNKIKKYSYVKGHFIDDYEASISIKERGFRFGDGVFETIRVANSTPYQFDLHIKRLKEGLGALKINADTGGLSQICKKLVQKNKTTNGFVRISISRGAGSKGYLPEVKGDSTIVVETVEQVAYTCQPVDMFVSSYLKIPNGCLPTEAKTMQGLNSTLARIEAQEKYCFEALMLNMEGYIAEGSSCNIFWLKGEKLFTPSLDCDTLPGTIRASVLRLCPWEVVEGKFKIDHLKDADEVFLTNVAWIVAPVKLLKPDNFKWKSFDGSANLRTLILDDMARDYAP